LKKIDASGNTVSLKIQRVAFSLEVETGIANINNKVNNYDIYPKKNYL